MIFYSTTYRVCQSVCNVLKPYPLTVSQFLFVKDKKTRIFDILKVIITRKRGRNGLFITLVPNSYTITYRLLFVRLKTLWTFFIRWFINLSFLSFLRQILIYRRGKFLCHHWGCTMYIELSAIVLSL